ncbi:MULTISPECIES: helix-turn-helix transcriptional regulator [unclassified Variovorax]|uniref:AraC family transcriptional regulator n=1 Tax=unclassified Variovorax TaxID=663243 RepID=UPI0025750EBC|nr:MULTISPECIES: helix-turn-helix transcriptional regulator [unclassified Variovorax]MDM0090106.1 helix-turn-helix transcriptional regulator [Variovorax sp. J22G40]MDM0148228.1 helix-turn-helix transcriptional regulator [Variovorax sp. J2P1-31]
MATQQLRIQDVEGKPGPFYFRYDEFDADSVAAAHGHSWGHLNYAAHGTLQMDTEGLRMLSPPQYAVWIPPDVVHSCHLRHAIAYRAIYVERALCARLPATPCTVRVGPIVRSILADFAARALLEPRTEADLRLAHVVVDQLAQAPQQRCYLPDAQSPALVAVLDALQAAPDDHRSLADWAQQVHVTERTLARHCQRELGMSLGEWRQRLRFLRAVDALEAGHTVQQIGFDLGYGTASAFIAMFQREAGTTPEQYRKEFCGM